MSVGFDHIEDCMGTTFKFSGRSHLEKTQTDLIILEACAVLHGADNTFSLYKPDSPLSEIARGEKSISELSPEVEEIWNQCETWRKITNGWFSAINPKNVFDPSGLVKTWAAQSATEVLVKAGINDFTLNAGGDIHLSDSISIDKDWRIAISKPVSIASAEHGVLTVVDLKNTQFRAMATSGVAERGDHIWNPKSADKVVHNGLQQVSVVATNLVQADVWATAAFAQGTEAIEHLNQIDNLEALFILKDGDIAATKGFQALFAK